MTEPTGAGHDDGSDERVQRVEARLRATGRELLDAEARRGPDLEAIVESVAAQIRREARAGRDIALAGSEPEARMLVTEGALRGALRDAVDDVEGVIVGRCAVRGDISAATGPLGASVAVSVAWPARLPEVADRIRAAVVRCLAEQTGRTPAGIDVDIIDLHLPEEP